MVYPLTVILVRITALVVCLFVSTSGLTQVRVSGIVYDISQKVPLEAVSVMSTSGIGTVSDSLGRFSIVVSERDSIWFSYLNKPTPKYPVIRIANRDRFEIALHVQTTTLKEVRFMPRNYRMDSLQNRQDYARAFDFRKPGISSSMTPGAPGTASAVGMDIDAFINMFSFKKNRRMLNFQRRLLKEEEEGYIDHRFNRALVIRLTKLRGASLDTFMTRYRPDIEFIRGSTDYELQEYIKNCFIHYQKYRRLMNEIRRPGED